MSESPTPDSQAVVPSPPAKVGRVKSSKLVVEERRRLVQSYLLRGFTPAQIFGVLKSNKQFEATLTENMIEGDVAAVRKAIKESVVKLDLEQEVGNTLTLYAELEKEAWKQYHAAVKPGEKAAILGKIQEFRDAQVKLLEKMGLLQPIQRVVHEIGDTWEAKIRELRQLRGVEAPPRPGQMSGVVLADEEEEILPLGEMTFIDTTAIAVE